MSWESDRQDAASWAWELLQTDDWVILDTETTGLDDKAEVCSLAAIDCRGEMVVSTYVKPTIEIPESAIRIHGITNEMVSEAPPIYTALPIALARIGCRRILIYNAEYDKRVLLQSLAAWHLPYRIEWNTSMIQCVMLPYSEFIGDWNEYKGNYRWQKLPGGDHSAMGDCKATLDVLKRMATAHERITTQAFLQNV